MDYLMGQFSILGSATLLAVARLVYLVLMRFEWIRAAFASAVFVGFVTCPLQNFVVRAQADEASSHDPRGASPSIALPRIHITDHTNMVTLSWDSQPSLTEIRTSASWSATGSLVDAVLATDKEFNVIRDAGIPGELAQFDIPKYPQMAFYSPSRAPVQRPWEGLRLDGTFIQYQSWMMTLDAGAWQKELEAMNRAGIRIILVQWLRYNETSFLPDDSLKNDPTESILAYADRLGLQVFLGLSMDDDWWSKALDASYLKRAGDGAILAADAIWRLYGAHPSFAGWYIPQEPWDGGYTDSQTSLLRSFFRRVSDRCKTLSNGKPVSFSPFFSGASTPEVMGAFCKKLLEGSGLDILMLQDGVGARGWDTEVEDRVPPYFRAIANACLAAGVALWSDLESFRLAGENPTQFAPASINRLCQQMAVEAPFVQHLVTFDFFHYISPHRGPAQKQLYDDYLRACVDRPFLPVFGRSFEFDPQFGYYQDRSPASIASELRATGYGIVRYILTEDSAVRPELITALHREGLGVWYSTFVNGTYSTRDLPPNWQEWKMVTRSDLQSKPLEDGYTRLCLNHPGYRAWKKNQMRQMIENHPFQGIDLMEPHWPEYPGKESPAYACFCASCLQAFHQMFPEEDALPNILDPNSPRSPARNPELWRKWLEFRHRSLASFLDDIVNGEQGIRSRTPQMPVCVWILALAETNGVQQVRDIHGEDPGEIVLTVKPDILCLQSHWPDWTRAGLRSDYVLAYAPFIQAARAISPDLPIMIQADTGSQQQNRRSWSWIRDFERACGRINARNTTFYEYFIGGYMYTDAPRIAALRQAGNEIELRFNKRLDPQTAADPARYGLSAGMVASARVDGNRVFLTTKDLGPASQTTLTVRGLADAASRRLFSDRPTNTLVEQTVRLR